MTRVRRRELVGVAGDCADRAAGRPGEVVENELVGREALGAEVPADRPVVDDDAVPREAERGGHLIAQVEGRLVRGDDADTVAFEPYDRGARLERRLVDPGRRELVLEDPGGACERRVHVAVRLDDVTLVIRVRDRRPVAATFEEPIGGGVGMEGRRAGTQRLERELVQRAVGNQHQADRLFRDLARVGRDRGHAVADEEDAVPAEHRPVLEAPPETLPADVGAGEDSAHARQRESAFGLNRNDARVRIRTADEGRLEDAGNHEVGRVSRGAGGLVHAVDATLGPVEELGVDQRAATVTRRHCAKPARTLSA